MTRLQARGERGFSMFIVIMTMFVSSMFVAAAFAAANGDLPVSGVATERKSDYAAAEAGLNFYLNRLQVDPDYWTKCASGPPPNASELNPVNQMWNGTGADPRRWRTVPGATDQYTIELIPAMNYEVTPNVPYTSCDTTKQQSFVDMNTGTFKIKATGRTGSNAKRSRSIVTTFRRDSFLNFVYFTNYENRDPAAESDTAERTRQQDVCADRYRTARKNNGCPEIQFATGDAINGPLHTNDENLYICGAPTFGRTNNQDGTPRAIKTDKVEVSGTTGTGHVANPGNGSCTDTPVINSSPAVFQTKSEKLDLPESNTQLETIATNSASRYAGRTIIRLRGGVMDITKANGTTVTGVAWPTSGVVYVANSGSCEGEIPTAADYDEPSTCGNVYVSGTYSSSLTIAAANDIIVSPTLGGTSTDANLTQTGPNDAMLGLIANNFVRVQHRADRSNCNTAVAPVLTNVTIEAAILSLQHSFIVDNYKCGKLGTLTVTGAIVQKYRGPVGTGTATSVTSGYLKNYWYDDRFRFRSPPYFLTPVDASWDVVRTHETVKGG